MLWPPGEPGQLEAHLRQLDQALESGRYRLQQREATANTSSPEVDSTYMGYVSLLHSHRQPLTSRPHVLLSFAPVQ